MSGLIVWLTVLYCPPRSRGAKPSDDQQQPAGLYPELAALGIRHGDCPAVQALVARTMALCPSIEMARKELRRQGLQLDKKTVRRIAEQLGTEFLVWRRRELLAWRQGLVAAGDELAGCRVAVQIDGGRVRLRENHKPSAKRQKGQRRKFKTPWREPKVLIIFAFDAQGKRDKHRLPLIDGTLLGPDHLAELVAWHLHRLGAAQAETVVFVSDGAPWIWERLDWIIARAGLEKSRTVQVLDWCHAVEHISRALTSLRLKTSERCRHFPQMRTWLKQNRHAEVVAELERLAGNRSKKHKVWTVIRYLQKHGTAGHLQYLTFKRRDCRSGAGRSKARSVESSTCVSRATRSTGWRRTRKPYSPCERRYSPIAGSRCYRKYSAACLVMRVSRGNGPRRRFRRTQLTSLRPRHPNTNPLSLLQAPPHDTIRDRTRLY